MDEHSAADRHRITEALNALHVELTEMISNLAGAAETVELDQGQQGRLSRIDAMQSQKMAEAQIRRARVRRDVLDDEEVYVYTGAMGEGGGWALDGGEEGDSPV